MSKRKRRIKHEKKMDLFRDVYGWDIPRKTIKK